MRQRGALDRAEEKKAFEKFMTWVMERWAATPEMHIYHYAPYEQTRSNVWPEGIPLC